MSARDSSDYYDQHTAPMEKKKKAPWAKPRTMLRRVMKREDRRMSPSSADEDSRLERQVEDLTETLYQTNKTLAENERKLYEFQDLARSQVASLHSDLERNMGIMKLERQQSCGFDIDMASAPVTPCGGHNSQSLEAELERERLARERAELETSRMIDLLHGSFRMHGPTSHNDESSSPNRELEHLWEELKHVKEQLVQCEGTGRQKKMEKNAQDLETYSELSEKSRQLWVEQSESRELHTHLDRTEKKLAQSQEDKEKILTHLEMATSKLQDAIEGKEELICKVDRLKSQLVKSGKDHGQVESRCSVLLRQLQQSQLVQEELQRRVREVEGWVAGLRGEKDGLEEKVHVAKERLIAKCASEQALKEQCGELQHQLANLQLKQEETKHEARQRGLEQMQSRCVLGERDWHQPSHDQPSSEQLKEGGSNSSSSHAQEQSGRALVELRHMVGALEQQLCEGRRESTQLKMELRHALEEKLTFQENAVQLEEELNEVHKRLVNVEKESTDSKLEALKIKSEMASLLQESKAFKEQSQDTKKKLRETQARLATMEQSSKVEVQEAGAKLEEALEQKSALEGKVGGLEVEVERRKGVEERMMEEVRAFTLRLGSCEDRRDGLAAEVESLSCKEAQLQLEKAQLEMTICEMQKKSELAEKEMQTEYAQNFKKYKSQCKRMAQEVNQLMEEKEQAMSRCEELYHQLENGDSNFAVIREENSQLKARKSLVECQLSELKELAHELELNNAELEANVRATKEKYHGDILALQSEKESLVCECKSLKQEVQQRVEQHKARQEALQAEVKHLKQATDEKQVQLEKFNAENMKLQAKLEQHSRDNQMLCAEVGSQERRRKLEVEQLRHEASILHESLSEKEQQTSEEMEALEKLHSQKLLELNACHQKTIAEQQARTGSLEVELADKQSTIRVLRRQQMLSLDEHTKSDVEDNLSRSLECAEKMRRKCKKKQREMSESFSDDNRSYCHQLAHQLEDREALLLNTAAEVDYLVEIMGDQVHTPVFSTPKHSEMDSRTWIADMLAKLQWLQKEVKQSMSQKKKKKVSVDDLESYHSTEER